MCGIFAAFWPYPECEISQYILNGVSYRCKHRGPDMSSTERFDLGRLTFHRLKVVDVSGRGMQPFRSSPGETAEVGVYSICNGEIYNFKGLEDKLRGEFGDKFNSKCDCEIVPHLIEHWGPVETAKRMDGVFAFVSYQPSTGLIVAGRDPFGVRSLYYDILPNGEVIFASEAKCFDRKWNPKPFPPGHIWTNGSALGLNYGQNSNGFLKYYELPGREFITDERSVIVKQLETLLYKSVSKRLMLDQPYGCFISGGVDSCSVASILNRIESTRRRTDQDRFRLKTFSIGLEGSTDLPYAEEMSNYLRSEHYQYVVTEEDFISVVPEVIKAIESSDPTTVRASTPMYLLSKYIKEYHPEVKVVFSGEGADEIFGSYRYFDNAPTDEEYHEETRRLLSELYLYDCLRADKTTGANGLELRVPFLDKTFVEYVLSIPVEYREKKQILRDAMATYLPNSIRNRPKEAFSDGVSSVDKSWHQTIRNWIKQTGKFPDLDGDDLEAAYYNSILEKMYPTLEPIPRWVPRWSQTTDSSARAL